MSLFISLDILCISPFHFHNNRFCSFLSWIHLFVSYIHLSVLQQSFPVFYPSDFTSNNILHSPWVSYFLHCKSVQKMNTSVPELCPSQYYIHPFSVHKCFQSLLSLSLFFLHLFIPPSYHICCLVYPHTQHLSPSASMHVSVPPSPTPSFSPFIQVLI